MPSNLDVPLSVPVISQRSYRGAYASHSHTYAQILIGRAGCLELEVDRRVHRVDIASGLIVPAGASHTFEAAATAHLLVLDVPPRAGLDRCRGIKLSSLQTARFQELDPAELIDALVGAPRRMVQRPLRLEQIDAALRADLAGRWTTVRLAALFDLSTQRFHSRMLELTGVTPGDYVRRRRLDAAQQRLKAGWPLDTTALAVGYASASALGYALRRDRGVGARSLRRSD